MKGCIKKGPYKMYNYSPLHKYKLWCGVNRNITLNDLKVPLLNKVNKCIKTFKIRYDKSK